MEAARNKSVALCFLAICQPGVEGGVLINMKKGGREGALKMTHSYHENLISHMALGNKILQTKCLPQQLHQDKRRHVINSE